MPKLTLQKQIRTLFTGLADTIRRHLLLWLIMMMAAGLVMGWILGSWATCGSQCSFNTSLFGALGTWVGGLATAAAFGITAQQLIATRHREERENDRLTKTALTKARKIRCVFYEGPDVLYLDDGMGKIEPKVSLRVINLASSAVTSVRVLLEPSGKQIASTAQIHEEDPNGHQNYWQTSFNPLDLELELDPDTCQALNFSDTTVSLEFEMDGHQFRRRNGEVELISR